MYVLLTRGTRTEDVRINVSYTPSVALILSPGPLEDKEEEKCPGKQTVYALVFTQNLSTSYIKTNLLSCHLFIYWHVANKSTKQTQRVCLNGR